MRAWGLASGRSGSRAVCALGAAAKEGWGGQACRRNGSSGCCGRGSPAAALAQESCGLALECQPPHPAQLLLLPAAPRPSRPARWQQVSSRALPLLRCAGFCAVPAAAAAAAAAPAAASRAAPPGGGRPAAAPQPPALATCRQERCVGGGGGRGITACRAPGAWAVIKETPIGVDPCGLASVRSLTASHSPSSKTSPARRVPPPGPAPAALLRVSPQPQFPSLPDLPPCLRASPPCLQSSAP